MTETLTPSPIRRIEAALPIALLRARLVTSRRFKPFTDAFGLSHPQWRVLRALAAGEPMESRALSERCVLMPPSVTRIMRDLENRSLVELTKSDNRRHKLWCITPAGKEIFDDVAVKAEGVYREIEAAYGKSELHDLLERLNKLIEVCEALPDTPPSDTLQSEQPHQLYTTYRSQS